MLNKPKLLLLIVLLVLAAVILYFITQSDASKPIGNSNSPAEPFEGSEGLPTPQVDSSTDIHATDGVPAETGEGPNELPTPAL